MAGKRKSANAQRGFTLMEAVVALGVISSAAVALVQLNAQSARAAAAVQTAALARIVAENQLVEAQIAPRLDLGIAGGSTELADRVWFWTRTVVSTSDAELDRVEIVVRLEDGDRTEARLIGFRGK